MAAEDSVVVRHDVNCPYCGEPFDLFSASWCSHSVGTQSKVCPRCVRCLCDHPSYGEPRMWMDAPLVFRKRGFSRLFLLYL
jgi:predicted amidophosphoribosyltransferase